MVSEYWKEAFCAALEDAGLVLPTNEQINQAASVIEGAHENYGMSQGYDCIPNPLRLENESLAKQLKMERAKTVCSDCGGRGRVDYMAGPWFCNSECSKCHGEGKVAA